jgi:hypothetical protein
VSPPWSGLPASRSGPIQITRERSRCAGRCRAEGSKGRRIAAGADAELEPAVAEQIENRGVLRHPHRALQRQGDDAGAEADARGLCGDVTEEGEGRRQAALALVEMVLRDPRGIEPGLLGAHDLLGREASSVRRRRLVEKPREEAQSFQLCEAFHATAPRTLPQPA